MNLQDKPIALASETEAIPPLLALPLELKREIFSYLSDGDEPNLAILPRTHSIFLLSIPKTDVYPKTLPRGKFTTQLLSAEADHPYLLPEDYFRVTGASRSYQHTDLQITAESRERRLEGSKPGVAFALAVVWVRRFTRVLPVCLSTDDLSLLVRSASATFLLETGTEMLLLA